MVIIEQKYMSMQNNQPHNFRIKNNNIRADLMYMKYIYMQNKHMKST